MKHSSVHSIYILTMIHSTTSLSGIRLITSLFMFVMCSHWHNPLLQLPFASISFVGANLLQQILSLCSTFCNNYFRYFPPFALISFVIAHILHQFLLFLPLFATITIELGHLLQQLLLLFSIFCNHFRRLLPTSATISFIFVHLSNNFLRYFLLCMV